MSLPKIATRDEWLAARKELLTKEKDLTRQRDALSIECRNLTLLSACVTLSGYWGRVVTV